MFWALEPLGLLMGRSQVGRPGQAEGGVEGHVASGTPGGLEAGVRRGRSVGCPVLSGPSDLRAVVQGLGSYSSGKRTSFGRHGWSSHPKLLCWATGFAVEVSELGRLGRRCSTSHAGKAETLFPALHVHLLLGPGQNLQASAMILAAGNHSSRTARQHCGWCLCYRAVL